jgi:Na+-transporting methylmalonyl-CoA/oxaloacetate decarboxylase gamma subunit
LINGDTILEDISVKTMVISMLVLLIAFFSFIPAFAQPPEEEPAQMEEQKEEQMKESEHERTADANATADVKELADANMVAGKNLIADANAADDANKIADANTATDANAIRARVEEFEGLDRALGQIDRKGKEEIREWKRRTEDKLDLILAVQEQITAEFNFLRELAVEEGDVKITVAIDKMLLDRQERFKEVIERLEKERERLRHRSEREEKKSRDRDRSKDRGDRNKRDTRS